MKKTISTYWPVAILLPITLAFCMHAGDGNGAAKRHEETSVAGVSAELARAISLGFVEDDEAQSAAIATQKTL
ncbi:hypothetical protein AWB76_00463 [Caballeronia temeraria]|uniref:Uncharacterized protein n=1 Tax=Caballeronia temeraria TaxID=1777137 RepID=A0A157ZB97_9BURK|nr:hypothetical protein [Caballeronia temeraria]SAK42794.1 hypothetical protein AWB76_00463 [Caballeronia temeraria]